MLNHRLLFYTEVNILLLLWMTGENALNANYLDKSWLCGLGTHIVLTTEIGEKVVLDSV